MYNAPPALFDPFEKLVVDIEMLTILSAITAPYVFPEKLLPTITRLL
jgi:hypothetical protein